MLEKHKALASATYFQSMTNWISVAACKFTKFRIPGSTKSKASKWLKNVNT